MQEVPIFQPHLGTFIAPSNAKPASQRRTGRVQDSKETAGSFSKNLFLDEVMSAGRPLDGDYTKSAEDLQTSRTAHDVVVFDESDAKFDSAELAFEILGGDDGSNSSSDGGSKFQRLRDESESYEDLYSDEVESVESSSKQERSSSSSTEEDDDDSSSKGDGKSYRYTLRKSSSEEEEEESEEEYEDYSDETYGPVYKKFQEVEHIGYKIPPHPYPHRGTPLPYIRGPRPTPVPFVGSSTPRPVSHSAFHSHGHSISTAAPFFAHAVGHPVNALPDGTLRPLYAPTSPLPVSLRSNLRPKNTLSHELPALPYGTAAVATTVAPPYVSHRPSPTPPVGLAHFSTAGPYHHSPTPRPIPVGHVATTAAPFFHHHSPTPAPYSYGASTTALPVHQLHARPTYHLHQADYEYYDDEYEDSSSSEEESYEDYSSSGSGSDESYEYEDSDSEEDSDYDSASEDTSSNSVSSESEEPRHYPHRVIVAHPVHVHHVGPQGDVHHARPLHVKHGTGHHYRPVSTVAPVIVPHSTPPPYHPPPHQPHAPAYPGGDSSLSSYVYQHFGEGDLRTSFAYKMTNGDIDHYHVNGEPVEVSDEAEGSTSSSTAASSESSSGSAESGRLAIRGRRPQPIRQRPRQRPRQRQRQRQRQRERQRFRSTTTPAPAPSSEEESVIDSFESNRLENLEVDDENQAAEESDEDDDEEPIRLFPDRKEPLRLSFSTRFNGGSDFKPLQFSTKPNVVESHDIESNEVHAGDVVTLSDDSSEEYYYEDDEEDEIIEDGSTAETPPSTTAAAVTLPETTTSRPSSVTVIRRRPTGTIRRVQAGTIRPVEDSDFGERIAPRQRFRSTTTTTTTTTTARPAPIVKSTGAPGKLSKPLRPRTIPPRGNHGSKERKFVPAVQVGDRNQELLTELIDVLSENIEHPNKDEVDSTAAAAN